MRLLILIAIISLACSKLLYQKVVLDDPNAKCLDGSPGAYYVWKGDSSKVLIFIEGGGWCGDDDLSSTIQNCYQRSKTDLGSSTNYGPTQTFTQGILSDDQDNYFKDWTKIFFKYCDGSGHQGSRAKPVLYKGANLYFRGQDITIAKFNSVNKIHKIFSSDVTHLVLTGESAGGLATFSWTNYIADRISKSTRFWSMPDSGIFVDEINQITKQNTYRIWIQNIMKLANQQVPTPVKQCNQYYPKQLWKCMFAQYLHPFMKAPLFTPQSLYDSWSLYYIVGIRCMDDHNLAHCNETEMSWIQNYHRKTQQVLFEIASNNENGVWAPICVNHCYLSNLYYSNQNYRIPVNSVFTLINSVQLWIQGNNENPRHIDFGEWPNNAPCSDYSSANGVTE